MKTQAIPKSRKSGKNRQNRRNRELKKELGKKLLAYSTTAGAVLTIGATTASADPIGFISSSAVEVVTFASNDLDLDIDGGGVPDLRFFLSGYGYASWKLASVRAYNTVTLNAEINASLVDTPADVAVNNLNWGDPISTGLFDSIGTTITGNTGGVSWALLAYTYLAVPEGNFLDQKGFVGVKFDIGGSDHFGWVYLDVHLDAITASNNNISIYGWGYETSAGAEIDAGEPVPEPATLLTLAMGAAGLYAWRRGRKRKGVKDDLDS